MGWLGSRLVVNNKKRLVGKGWCKNWCLRIDGKQKWLVGKGSVVNKLVGNNW
jgi:hypothetical protein